MVMGNQFDEYDTEIQEIIDALRADHGRLFRALLRKLRNDESADSRELAEALSRHPDLRDFIVH
jgi:hypothetical protein